jgi:hypothetical protein
MLFAAVHESACVGTRLTSICTATIPSIDAGPTDVGDAHLEVSVRSAQRPTSYGAVSLCSPGSTVQRDRTCSDDD